ncbi:MAG: hypothetical protein IT287_02000 [Bdellovibrionaceae bacterium]|nr:hypothetical protein [Pseudobdellovibrionaceae bacterium]
MKFLVVLWLTILCPMAQAEIKYASAPIGYSKLQGFGINDNVSVTILGGFAGSATSCTATGTSTCNNCTAAFTECNQNRAYPAMEIQISFSSTDKKGKPLLTTLTAEGQTTIPIQTNTLALTTQENQTVTITTTWGAICNTFIDGNATCSLAGKNQSFKIGIDSNSNNTLEDSDDDIATIIFVVNDPTDTSFDAFTDPDDCSSGLCNFTLFPGDEKAYIKNTNTISPAERPIAAVHFLCQTGAYADIIATDICATVSVTNGNLDKDFITGLPNGELRFFYAASEDDTGNIGLFMKAEDTDCPANTTINGHCRAVTPSEVSGLFNDNCFIATAAYGSLMEPQVKILRAFRDQYLKTNVLGKLFINTYYKLSPPFANWIAASESRKSVTRLFLTPVVFSVKTFMAAPLLSLFTFCTFIFLVLGMIYKRSQKLSHNKGFR